MYFWIGGAIAAVALAVGTFILLRMTIREPYTGPTFKAVKQKLQVTIVERGSLESAENSEIVVQIKAGAKGSTTASIIKWVIEEGKEVRAGDKIVDLDDSGFQDQLKTQRNTVSRAEADWIYAQTSCTFQESQNVSDKKTAEVNLMQAELDLRKYAGELAAAKIIHMTLQAQLRTYLQRRPAEEWSDFEQDVRKESAQLGGKFTSAFLQDLNDYEGKIETARSDKESWADRAAWSKRMVDKGLYSPSQADSDQSRLESTVIALRKSQGDLDIYRKFDVEKWITKYWSEVKEKQRAKERVDIQAESQMKQKKADEASKKAIYDQELDRQKDMEKDEKYYKILSPQDGMIAYYVPEQSRGGQGTQQAIVAQGEPVREGQKLIRIPNLSKMLVNTRAHEAMFRKVRGDISIPLGSSIPFAFSLGNTSPLSLTSFHVGYDKLKNREKFKDFIKDKDQTIISEGQKARIRVDANPRAIYEGRVRTLATMPSQTDFLSSDVKVYQTMVSIDSVSKKDNLKPGMSAEVTILAEDIGEVLVIPIQSVVGNVAMGDKRKCFVLDAQGYPQERDIEVGKSNDKHVEVKSGIKEGEIVVMNPRVLLPEKSDMKPATSSSRRGAEVDDGSGGGGGGSKKGGKKGDGSKKGGRGAPPPEERSENIHAPREPVIRIADRGNGNKQRAS